MLGSNPKATLLLTAAKFLAEHLENDKEHRDRPLMRLTPTALARGKAEAALVLDDPDDIVLYEVFVARMRLAMGDTPETVA